MDVSTQRLINYTTRASGVDQWIRYRTSRVLVNEEADPQPSLAGLQSPFYITPSLVVTYLRALSWWEHFTNIHYTL